MGSERRRSPECATTGEMRRQRTFRQPRPFLPTPTSLARCKPSMPAGFEHDPGRREDGDNPCGRAEPLTLPESSRTNADDRLPRAPLGRVEGGDSFVEGRDVADVRPQPSVTHPPDDLTQLATIRRDYKVDGQAVSGPRLGRAGDGHQRSSGANLACGPPLDVSADDVEHQVDAAHVFQRVVLKVDELHRAEVERLLTVDGAAGADDIGASL